MDIELLGSILFGLIVGVAAKLIMPGKDPGGIFVTILLGIGGALLGGWVHTKVASGMPDRAEGWILSVLGATVILAIYRVFRTRQIAQPKRD